MNHLQQTENIIYRGNELISGYNMDQEQHFMQSDYSPLIMIDNFKKTNQKGKQFVDSKQLGLLLLIREIKLKQNSVVIQLKVSNDKEISNMMKWNSHKILSAINQWNVSSDHDEMMGWMEKQNTLYIRSTIFSISISNEWLEQYINTLKNKLIDFFQDLSKIDTVKMFSQCPFLMKDALNVVKTLSMVKRIFNNFPSVSENCQNNQKQLGKLSKNVFKNKNKLLVQGSQYSNQAFWNVKKGNKIIRILQILKNINFIENISNKYSDLTKSEYHFKLYLDQNSFNNQTNKFIRQKQIQLQSEVKQGGQKYIELTQTLYCKRPIEGSSSHFNNELFILKFLRFYQCNRFASYFLDSRENNVLNDCIFIESYPQKFTKQMKAHRKIDILIQVAQALCFLQQFFLLHRDLKPNNILLTKSLNIKIIDFGSSYFSTEGKVFPEQSTLNESLRTTRFYNFFYEDLPEVVKNCIGKSEFEKHPNFDIYSFGVLMEQILILPQFEGEVGSYVFENLQYLSQKCRQKNPDDRFSPQIVLMFLIKIRCYLRLIQYRGKQYND